MKVLITGAVGRVGATVSRTLHAAGLDVRLTDRRFVKDFPAPIEVADLLDRDVAYQLLKDCDAVVHLGNHPFFPRGGDAQKVYAENCAINMNVFQAAMERGAHKIVFTSSIQVINGDRLKHEDESRTPPSGLAYLPLDSDTPANPRNPYSLSKHAAEELLKHYVSRAGVQCIAVRLPACMGEEWWARHQRHRSANVHTDFMLDEAFSYLHVADFASLVLALLRTDLPGYRCYLPAAQSLTVDLSPTEAVRRFFPDVELRKPLSELRSLVDISRITHETGWHPAHHF